MKKLAFIFLMLSCIIVHGQNAPKPYGVLPTDRQIKWQETEMYCIIHLGAATFTDKEWGFGDENPANFNPVAFDASEIVSAAKAGGFKGIVVVAKHHDGLCIWPTKTTPHNISATGYKDGKGDMVKEYQLACEKLGMKMGLYCSPWDRNSPQYGKPEYVTEIYRNQLKELYQNYGPLFMSWHDGANGGDGYYGGTREIRKIDRSTYYEWPVTWGITRKMQPAAALFGDIGPDVRWVGNESGFAGETSWATYTPVAPEAGKIPSNGFVLSENGVEGTRNGKFWMPAECDVPMRPGWFYHQSQDGMSKSAYTLLDLYYKSVGRGACLDLGISPDKSGRLTDEDKGKLKEFGDLLRSIFKVNLAKGAKLSASNIRGKNKQKFGPANLVDENRYTYWATDDQIKKPELIVDLGTPKTFNVIRLRENIKLGQRIEQSAIDIWENSQWKELTTVTSIGANRLIRFSQNVITSKLRLRIISSPVSIALSDFGLFLEPVYLSSPIIERSQNGEVSIRTVAPVSSIRFTVDGSEPNTQSAKYENQIPFSQGGTIKAISVDDAGKTSSVSNVAFNLSKTGWKIEPITVANTTNARKAIDDNPATNWNINANVSAEKPAEIIVDMGKMQQLKAFTYLPRQDKNTDGMVDGYTFSVSDDGKTWVKIADGEFANIKANPIEQVVPFANPHPARYFKFTAKHVISGNNVTAAEISVRVN